LGRGHIAIITLANGKGTGLHKGTDMATILVLASQPFCCPHGMTAEGLTHILIV